MYYGYLFFPSNFSVYTDKIAWRTSRAYVNEQIRQLRAQLGELKEIRSHLKAKRLNTVIELQSQGFRLDTQSSSVNIDLITYIFLSLL